MVKNIWTHSKIIEHGQKIFEHGQKIFELADGFGISNLYSGTDDWKILVDVTTQFSNNRQPSFQKPSTLNKKID